MTDMSIDTYLRYLNSRDDAAKRLAFEKPISTPQDEVPVGWIIAAVPFAYFVVFLIEEFA